MRRFLVLRVLSALVLVSGLFAAVLLCAKVIRREQAEIRTSTEAHAGRIALQLQTGVLAALEPLERLGQWWLTQGKPAAPEDWASDGRLFLSQSPGLREALWVDPDGRQRWSARPGATPNETRAKADDRVLRQIDAVRNGKRLEISEVFASSSTSSGIYVCFPIVRAGRLRGYVLGLYDAGELLQSVARGATLQEQFIKVLANGQQIYASSSAEPRGAQTASAAISVANQTWGLNLSVPLHYFREFRDLILAVIGVVGALIYSFIVLLALSHRWSSALQRVNTALEREVERRGRAEAEVRDLNRDLSRKVADFETLLDVIPIGIAVANDPDCRTLRVNPALANMLGVPGAVNIPGSGPDQARMPFRIKRNGREILPGQLPMQVASVTGKSVLGEEDQIVRADGTVVEVLSFAAPLFDENSQVRGVLNAYVDISERKRLEQRLQRAERRKSLGAMAAGIAHDFNNLLTTIIGQASLASEQLPPASETRNHLAASLDAAHHASSLIQKVLAYTGHSPHTLRPMDPAETIRDVAPWLTALIAPIAIHFNVLSELPELLADAHEVRQVLQNLVLNAAEATVEEGAVIQIVVDICTLTGSEPHLTLADDSFRPGPYVRIEVKDHGAGMPADIAERAFDPFFSTKFLGRGLGLAEVLGIMRAHKGAVRLTTAPGMGTSIQLFFPAYERPYAKVPEQQSLTVSQGQ